MALVYKVQAVIFDMDGVITHTMPCHYRAWKKVLAAEGIPVRRRDVYLREGQAGAAFVHEIYRQYQRSITPERAMALLRAKEKHFQETVHPRYVSGSRTFLRDLKKTGLRLGLVTGTARHELTSLLPQEIQDFFSTIITGSDVKRGKPHPEPYLKALRALKIAPSKAVVIENAPFGIRSAKAAGIACLALETSLPAAYLRQADHVFSSIRHLRTEVQFITQQRSYP